MSSRSPMPTADLKTRPLGADDLAAVVAIDAAEGAQPRRRYLERRLAQALRFPELHAQFAVEANGKLSGFVLGRLLEGEFGQTEPGLRLEEIGVRTEARGRGTGRTLIAALEDWGRQRGALEMRTTALWTQHAMLRFLEADGWRLGRNQVLDCVIGEEELGSARERPLASPDEERPGDANDYSARGANDFEALARDLTEVRALNAADLDGVARIDRRLTGGDRSRYLRHAIDEALAESGIRRSSTARSPATSWRASTWAISAAPRRWRSSTPWASIRCARATASAVRCSRSCWSTWPRCASSAWKPWWPCATSHCSPSSCAPALHPPSGSRSSSRSPEGAARRPAPGLDAAD